MSASDVAKVQIGRKLTPNSILVIVLIFVIVFTGLVVVFSANRDVAKWDSSTPQGVVQIYLTSMINGDRDQAASMLSTGSKCRIEEIDRAYVATDSRVYLTSTKIKGDKATVKIKVDTQSGDPFGEVYSEAHTYRLTRSESNWRLIGIPWPLYACGMIQK